MEAQGINKQLQRLKLQANGIVRYPYLSEVVYLKGDGNYTSIILNDLSEYTKCKILKNYETELGCLFFRCHKTFLINYDYIKEINKKNLNILLTTGDKIPISRNKARTLEKIMKIKT
jgi:two-component system LytT family response regulator